MSKVTIKLNRAGVRAILQSAEARKLCEEHAAATLAGCGDGYRMDSRVGKNRVNAMVYADTHQAKRDNLRNNTLLGALK